MKHEIVELSDKPINPKVPDGQGADNECLITDVMIDAGAKAFINLGLGVDDADTVAFIIFEAMERVRGRCGPTHDRSI